MEDINFIQQLTIWALPVLFAITLHEVAHGWVALRCGDNTALLLGRLSLNPVNHIDLMGTVIVPGILLMLGGVLFGWAKPVPVNWNRLNRPKRDMILVSLAGPLANLLMVFFWAVIARLALYVDFNYSAKNALFMMGLAGININLLLMIFNLLPLPPLDGSKVVMGLLPDKLSWQYSRIEPYGFFIVLILLYAGVLSYIIVPLMKFLMGMLFVLFQLQG